MNARGEVNNRIQENGETYVQECVIRAVSNADPIVVLDIGANVGQWTGAFLKSVRAVTHKRIILFACEPCQDTFSVLQRSVVGVPQDVEVRMRQIAFSDSTGCAPMMLASQSGETNSLNFDSELAAKSIGIVDVSTITLEDFCGKEDISHVHLVKCDAEGHDLRIISSALPMLKAGAIDVFQFEYNHRWVYSRKFLKDVFDLIRGLPYVVARIRPNAIEILGKWHPEFERFFEGNYLLVKNESVGWFCNYQGIVDKSNTYA